MMPRSPTATQRCWLAANRQPLAARGQLLVVVGPSWPWHPGRRANGRRAARHAASPEGRGRDGRKGWRVGSKEGRKEGGREGGKEGRREGGREGGREGKGREGREGGKPTLAPKLNIAWRCPC